VTDIASQSVSHHLDPCFKDSVLLNDVELHTSDDDSDTENSDSYSSADIHKEQSESDIAQVPAAPPSSSQKPCQSRRPLAAISEPRRTRPTRPQHPGWKSTYEDLTPLQFDEIPGPSRAVHKCHSALDFFMLFFLRALYGTS